MKIKKRIAIPMLAAFVAGGSFFPAKQMQSKEDSTHTNIDLMIQNYQKENAPGTLLFGLRGDSLMTEKGLEFAVDSADAVYNRKKIASLSADKVLDVRSGYGFRNIADLLNVQIGVRGDTSGYYNKVQEWRPFVQEKLAQYNAKFGSKVTEQDVFAKVHIESGLFQYGISTTGCLGFGQLNSDFTKGASQDRGIAKEGINPFDGKKNMDATIRYYCYLSSLSDDAQMTNLFYNQGVGTVNAAISETKKQGLVPSVENILQAKRQDSTGRHDYIISDEGRKYIPAFEQAKKHMQKYLR
jgi:hypothetical protein